MEPSGTTGAAAPSRAPSPLLAASCACALVAGLVAAKATRDALFLNTFDAALLPRVMTASAVASFLAVLLMTRAMARFSPRRVLIASLSAATALVLVEWGLTFPFPRLAAVMVHLHVGVFGATQLSAYWSMVGERFDPYTAKRVMSRIGAGAAVGGILGGGFAWLAARSLPVPSMLLTVALLGVLGLLLVLRVPPLGRAQAAGTEAPAGLQLTAAVGILREGSYLRHLAWLVALGALMESLLDYTFNAQAAASLPRGPALASFLAAYQAGIGLLGLVALSLLARPALEGLGLAGTVAVRPLLGVLTSLAAVFDPRLLSLLLARGSHAVLTTSLFRSGYELLFTPLPAHRKRGTKTIIDVGFDKVGSVLGGLLSLAVVGLFPADSVRVLLGICVLIALVSLVVTSWLHSGYVGALEASLRSGALRLEPEELKDATTRFFYTMTGDRQSLLGLEGPAGLARTGAAEDDPLAAAIADLRSGQRSRILRALPQGRDPDIALVPFLIPLLAKDAVLGEVVKMLRRAAPRVTGQLLDALLDPGQAPLVRRRVPRVLVAAPTPRTAEGLLRGLKDERFDVRARCGLALLRIRERNPAVVVPREAAFAAALEEMQRQAAAPPSADAGVTGSHDGVVEHVFTLLSLVLDREPLQLASRALQAEDRTLIGTALEYLETVLPDDLRRALWKRLQIGVRERSVVRPSHELLDELLRSSNALKAPRRQRGRKGPDETG